MLKSSSLSISPAESSSVIYVVRMTSMVYETRFTLSLPVVVWKFEGLETAAFGVLAADGDEFAVLYLLVSLDILTVDVFESSTSGESATLFISGEGGFASVVPMSKQVRVCNHQSDTYSQQNESKNLYLGLIYLFQVRWNNSNIAFETR